MDRSARKAACAAYKERKPGYGVFAVICVATGETWVGQSRHLDTQQNSLWFTLRQGSCPYGALQTAWNVHGQGGFRFEELERLRDDFPALARPSELRNRQSIWRERLRAAAL
ncbi:GIY-YIG nuclease family protein [Teichococcus aestuarii]|uniref:GIY-YIG nuclease family protein n=1 Tax=Teichococcus aestuarii TaxID=568898 RepID=UPI003609240E